MIFLFGDFELDDARVELRRAGVVVSVQPKVLRLLLYLVLHRDRAVSNEELLSALWPSEVVESGSIKRAVKSARAVLCESANETSSIRTVRGHGYQFVATLRSAQAPVIAPPASARARAIAVERATLSRSLAECWLGAEHGRGQALLLSGEAGVGKSWALRWLAAHAEERAAIVWFGRAADVEGAPAYWPFITMLRDALRQPDEFPWLELMGEGATDLAQALPELRSALQVQREAPTIEATAARFRFFDSTLGLLQRAAERAPLLIIVDDLALADAPTIQLFTFLARHAAVSRILLAASIRLTTRAADDHALLDDLSTIARTLHITGLTPDEVAEFVAAHTSASAEPRLIARLTELTGGNPLLLTHTMHVCRPAHADAAPRWDALDMLTQSHGVRSAIARHVAELRPSALACLQAAALLGQTFSRRLLAKILEQDELAVDGQLREAAHIGLLTPLDDVSDEGSFTHGLVREVLAHSQDGAQRQELHARTGEALAVLHARADAEPSAVAHHFLVAGHYERALQYSMLAAKAALQQLADSAAVQHYTRALQALDQLPPNPQLRAAIMLDKASAQAQAGAFMQARATFMNAAKLARELGNAVLLARAALGIVAPLEDEIDEELLGLLREALRTLDEHDEHWPLLAAALAKLLSHGRDREASQAAITSALGALTRLHDPALRARALAMCHEAMTEPEQLAAREPLSSELAAMARSGSDIALLVRAMRIQIQDGLEVGDMQKVEVSLTLLEQLAERARDPFARWHAKTFRSMCAMVRGELEAATEHAEEALRLGSMVSPSTARHGYLVQLSGILRLRGEAERARSLVYEGTTRYPKLTGWRCAVGISEFEVGRAGAAREIFTALMAEGIASLARDAFVLSALCPLADLCAWVGDAASARQLYAALLPYAAHCGTIGFGVLTYGPITRYLGALSAQHHSFEQAVKHFEEAERTSSRMRSPTFSCVTALTHARAVLDPACPPRLRHAGFERLRFARKLASARGFGAVTAFAELLDVHARQLQAPSVVVKSSA